MEHKIRLFHFVTVLSLYEKLKRCEKKVYFYAVKGAEHGGAPFCREDVLDIVDKFIQNTKKDIS